MVGDRSMCHEIPSSLPPGLFQEAVLRSGVVVVVSGTACLDLEQDSCLPRAGRFCRPTVGPNRPRMPFFTSEWSNLQETPRDPPPESFREHAREKGRKKARWRGFRGISAKLDGGLVCPLHLLRPRTSTPTDYTDPASARSLRYAVGRAIRAPRRHCFRPLVFGPSLHCHPTAHAISWKARKFRSPSAPRGHHDRR